MCVGKVQGVGSNPDLQRCIAESERQDLQDLYSASAIWQRNLANDSGGYAAPGKNGTYDGQMDVWCECQEQIMKWSKIGD